MAADEQLVMSSLCQTVERDGVRVRVNIYSTGRSDWKLEIIADNGKKIVWDGTFNSEKLALEEFHQALAEEGLPALIGAT